MNKKIEKFFPLGFPYKMELSLCWLSCAFTIGYSFIFFLQYEDSYDYLFENYGSKVFLKPDSVMPDFYSLVSDCFTFYLAPFLLFFAFAVFHWVYHYQHSKSIYLMKRLPQKGELYFRCFALPAIETVVYILIFFVLLFGFYFYYMNETPSSCIAPDQLQKLWENRRLLFNA